MKRKIIIKGLKDKFTVTPEIKNHLNLLKEYYKKQDISKNNIDIQIIFLRNVEELNINLLRQFQKIYEKNIDKYKSMQEAFQNEAHFIQNLVKLFVYQLDI